MKFKSVFAAGLVAASFGADNSLAQSSQVVPAEFPPSSFKGRQYVDSTGCVFIRAGIDGAVTWVPRLTRERRQVCGAQPTLSASALAQVNAPRSAVAPEVPAPKPTPAPAPKTVAAAPAPTPAPAPAPAPKAAPAPKPAVAAVPPAPQPKPAPAPRAVASIPSDCTDRSRFSQNFLVSKTQPVRCGPQDEPHVSIKDGPPSADATFYTLPRQPQPSSRSGSRGSVFETLPEGTADLRIPEGYVPIWTDDRLNPNRGPQGGRALAQSRSFESFQAAGQARPLTEPALGFAAAPQQVAVTTTQPAKKASHRYVQVGAFSDAAQAQSTAQRLANSGLPTRMGPYKRGGQDYTLVMVGPFDTQSQLDDGLSRVQAMGYKSANLKR